jgi:hypothetical protein
MESLRPQQRQPAIVARARFKPIPDEEGTEIGLARSQQFLTRRFKPIPDEERTEMVQAVHVSHGEPSRFKPIPDEEGTEM